MFTKAVTYKDLDGEERTETLYFHMSESELADMELEKEGSLSAYITKIVELKDGPKIQKMFKELVLKSYGEKSPDGRAFIKRRNGVRLAEEFEQTVVFSKFYMMLAQDANLAADFINGIANN